MRTKGRREFGKGFVPRQNSEKLYFTLGRTKDRSRQICDDNRVLFYLLVVTYFMFGPSVNNQRQPVP
jgi:hypothetical protein